MNTKKIKIRDEISSKYKWNLDSMYSNENALIHDIESGLILSEDLLSKQGQITSSAINLLEALELYSSSMKKLEKAYIYAHMRHDEDNSNSKYIELLGKTTNAITQFSSNSSYLIPELLQEDKVLIDRYVKELDDLKVYAFMLDEIFQQKSHTLSKEQEYIIASYGELLSSNGEIFSILNDVDMDFGIIKDENGQDIHVTHGIYSNLMESDSRAVRKNAYNAVYSKYKELNNTISTIYNYNVKKDVISSNLRNYTSCLDSELSTAKIPESVYTSLINAVNKKLDIMHEYIKFKKEYLGIEKFKMYDIYKPLLRMKNFKYTYEEAVDIACEALYPLGEEYVSILRNGLLNEGWVDVYENNGKTSGAYSFGSYESKPYILMNFTGELKDVFTLVHEGGHSMHSYYTRKNQPYIYGDHSIFTAEVASTVNETLLIKYLLNKYSSKEDYAYLLNFYIDEFKSTLFRQTMFAEFELLVHEKAEQGETLTAEYLNSEYKKLNTKYYGTVVSDDDMIQYEWSRIPHFYNSFYVYQYATGYSAANAIVNRILNEGKEAKEDYLKFLTTGSSNYPIELLKIAGVDMSKEEPVLSALHTFESLVNELIKVLKG